MIKLHNPALHEEPRNQEATVISTRQESSILEWLQSTGRLVPRESDDYDAYYDDEEAELMPELAEIMATNDTFEIEPEQELDLAIEQESSPANF